MVKLSLSSNKGTGARYFPHAGYLALTPLKVEGVVRTRLDDDRKPVLASDILIAVRCYEARIGRTGITHSNLLVDYSTPLWTKPTNEAWAEVGDGDWPFRLVVPPKLTGHSTANFQEYRVFWRIEAVLNHIPMTGVGHRQVKTYDLPLMRYDPGEALPPSPSTWAQAGTAKHAGAPTLNYLINTPPFPLGPMDLVPVSLKLNPTDPAVRVHSVAFAVERRLEFNNPPLGAKSLVDDTSLSSTTNLIGVPSPSSKGSSKAITFLVASAEATDVPRDEKGVYAKTVTLQVPSQKSSSHWAVGETMRTLLVTLRFFLRVKVTLYGPNGTVETVELGERELCLVSSNESQRRVAMAKYTEAVDRARARDANKLPSPPPSPIDGVVPQTPMTASSLHAKGSTKAKSIRRPHTSAGPRDSAREVARGASRRAAQSFRDARTRARPHAASPKENGQTASTSSSEREPGGGSDPELASQPEHVRAWEDELERIETRSRWRTAVETPAASGGGSPTARSAPALKTSFASPTQTHPPSLPSAPLLKTSPNHLSPPPPHPPPLEDSVQAWEEELERIAAQSRRRSVEMLGFNSERRRTRPRIDISGATPAVQSPAY